MGKNKLEITLLTDFYGSFLTKVPSNPYKSGFDLNLLEKYFYKFNILLVIKRFSDIQFFENYENKLFIYTSIEDPNGYYRSFIDDILYGLEQAGATIIPQYKFFKSHENKVFMEILRNIILKNDNDIKTYKLGSYSDFIHLQYPLLYPVLVKKSTGSASNGVFLSNSIERLKKIVKQITNTYDYKSLIMDFLLAQKKRINKIQYFNRYSPFRKKFIIQNFIENLPGDYKVLIFYEKYYVLKRLNRANDFRASGSGNFINSNNFNVSNELLNNCEIWFNSFDVPCASFDVACKEDKYFLLEFQFVSFGTYTQTSAKNYFCKINDKWEKNDQIIPLEEVYADSIIEFLRKKAIITP